MVPKNLATGSRSHGISPALGLPGMSSDSWNAADSRASLAVSLLGPCSLLLTSLLPPCHSSVPGNLTLLQPILHMLAEQQPERAKSEQVVPHFRDSSLPGATCRTSGCSPKPTFPPYFLTLPSQLINMASDPVDNVIFVHVAPFTWGSGPFPAGGDLSDCVRPSPCHVSGGSALGSNACGLEHWPSPY